MDTFENYFNKQEKYILIKDFINMLSEDDFTESELNVIGNILKIEVEES